MFVISEDLTIHITRGDAATFSICAGIGDTNYEFQPDDVVRFQVFGKKDCATVVLRKDITVSESTDTVEIPLESADTTIGEVISKPVEYWYEVELNPDTRPQTVIGYDENGAKVFKLYPEGGAVNE